MKGAVSKIVKFLRTAWLFSVLPLSLCVLTVPAVAQGDGSATASAAQWVPMRLGQPLLREPVWVYNDWSAYDELSDNIPLTEALAMKELGEIVRLKKLGVHFDYYMMDAFWFAPDGGYRTWRTPNWPSGPDRWIAECRA